MHWVCKHGENRIFDSLVRSKAKEYLPDNQGMLPIDYAGRFNHSSLVIKIIKVTSSRKSDDPLIQNEYLQSKYLYWAMSLSEDQLGIDEILQKIQGNPKAKIYTED